MNKIVFLLAALALSGCELLQSGLEHCDQAQGAVDLICSGVPPLIPVGAGGGQITDAQNPDCVILTSADSVPIEYCKP